MRQGDEEREHRRPLFLGATVLLIAVAIAPIWCSRFLPLLDEPNHLSALFILRSLAEASSPLHHFYEQRVAPVPYLLHYGIAYLFSFLIGVEPAHKLALSIYVLSIPAAALYWCIATQRSVFIALTTIPVAFSVSWSRGFHPFNLGLSAFLLGTACMDALLRDVRWPRVAWATLAGVACYFGHPLTLALYWICAATLFALYRPGWRTLLVASLTLVPSAVLYGSQARSASIGLAGLRRMLGKDFPAGSLDDAWGRVLDFPEYAVNPLAGPQDSAVFVVMLAVAATLLVWGVARTPRCRLQYRTLVLAIALAILYFSLPQHFDEPVYMWIARGRIAAPIAFFLLLSPAIGPSANARLVVFTSAILGAYVPFATARAYHQFGTEMRPMERVLASCPRTEQVLTVRLDGFVGPTPGYNTSVHRQLASWVQVVHGGGFNPEYFKRTTPFPFSVRRSLPRPHWRRHHEYRKHLKPEIFGCVLTMGVEKNIGSPRFKLERKEGRFALYRPAHSRKN